jgi:Dyp-type peroxidase family
MSQIGRRKRWNHGVPVHLQGPSRSYRPDMSAPTLHGLHQPGIATPQARYAQLTAYQGELPGAWAKQAERLMRERSCTVTIGLGNVDTPGMKPLPPFPGDELEFEGGDLCVLIQSDEPITTRLAGRVRWEQHGERRQALGFKDGTAVPRRPVDLERHVWINRNERTFLLGGTFLVVRRIRILDDFRQLPDEAQEQIIGRHKHTGAPLGKTHEFERPGDLPPNSHVAQAQGFHVLRRGYDTEDGLLFLAFMNDPRRQFVPLQNRLAAHDALHPYTRHIGSAVFAIPPGNFLTQPLL